VNWSHPAYANKHIYARNDEQIICASLAVDGKYLAVDGKRAEERVMRRVMVFAALIAAGGLSIAAAGDQDQPRRPRWSACRR